MSAAELKLSGDLKKKYGEWDLDRSETLNYDEIKYKENSEVISLLNSAYTEPSAVTFFQVIPHFRVATLLLDSRSGEPLDHRYYSGAGQRDLNWFVGVSELILSSGAEGAEGGVDILLGGATFSRREGILSLLQDELFVANRTHLFLKDGSQSVHRGNVAEYFANPGKRKELTEGFFEAQSPLTASYVLGGLKPIQQYALFCDAARRVRDKIFNKKNPIALDDAAFENLVRFVKIYFQGDPENFYYFHQFVAKRDKAMADFLSGFLLEDQREELQRGLEKGDAKQKLPAPPSVLQIKTEEEFEKRVLQNKMPVIAIFSASWCGPCQVLKPKLADWAKLYGASAAVAYVEVDAEQDPDKKLEGVLSNISGGKWGVPTLAIFHEGHLITQGHMDADFVKKLNAVRK